MALTELLEQLSLFLKKSAELVPIREKNVNTICYYISERYFNISVTGAVPILTVTPC